jgi:cytosine/adenosine deaminase-related metal-dependent hydrolase
VPDPLLLAGKVLIDGELVEGFVEVLDGRVATVGEGDPPREPTAVGTILPGIVNHHSHVGDAAVPPPPEGLTPDKIFPPPCGYKHLMLEELPEEQLMEGISSFLDRMLRSGTVHHVDFREGGVKGIGLLERARGKAEFPPTTAVYGRPYIPKFDREELDKLLPMVDGLGLSAVMDWPWEDLRDVVDHARGAGVGVALHCSETQREELSRVLELDPAFLVHMVFATRQDLEDLAAAGVPVVVCPRSTARFTRPPPVRDMVRAGLEVRLGTDNAMLQGPDVLEDVSFLLEHPETRDALDPLQVLRWALRGSKGSNTNPDIGVNPGTNELVLFTSDEEDPLGFLQSGRGACADLVLADGRLWSR